MGNQQPVPAGLESVITWNSDECPELFALSRNANTFLHGHPSFVEEEEKGFNLQVSAGIIRTVLLVDPRLRQWCSKLVPKHVSEEKFWSNYFSHVRAVGGFPNLNKMEGAKETITDGTRQKPVAEGPFLLQALTPRWLLCPSLFLASPAIRWAVIGSGDQLEREICQVVGGGNSNMNGSSNGNGYGSRSGGGGGGGSLVGCKLVNTVRVEGKTLGDVKASLLSVFRDPDVDVVFCALPPGYHRALAELVQGTAKPCCFAYSLGRSAEEGFAICSRLSSNGNNSSGNGNGSCSSSSSSSGNNSGGGKEEEFAPVFVSWPMRCMNRFHVARFLLAEKRLGTVTSCQYRFANDCLLGGVLEQKGWRGVVEQAGGGPMMDFGLRAVDILDFLLGPLSQVQGDAVCDQPQVQSETRATMLFRFHTNGLGVASWNFTAAVCEDRLEIDGSSGKLTMSLFGDDPPVLVQKDGKHVVFRDASRRNSISSSSPPPLSTAASAQLLLLEEIVQFLRHRSLNNMSSPPSPPSNANTDTASSSFSSSSPSTLSDSQAALLSSLPSHLPTAESSLRAHAVIDAVLRSFYRSRTDDFWTRPNTWKTS